VPLSVGFDEPQHPERRAAPVMSPAADDVDLWVARLDADPQALARLESVLSETERARLARVIRPLQRNRLLAARATLREVLAGYVGAAAGELRIKRGPGGKPFLPDAAELAFNLSHSGDLVAVAVTRRPGVGIDIERLGRRVRPHLIRGALAPAERELVEGVPAERREEAFLRHWTAKEAYAKALGPGIAVGMASVMIGDALREPELVGVTAWSLQRFDPAPGAVGAVVAAGGHWRGRLRASPA
jgi:4'-phosphopantetheinyl transferase